MDDETPIVERQSTKAEEILAWKELLSSSEAKEFTAQALEGAAKFFGQTKSAKALQASINILMMLTAFVCIGALALKDLVPPGTTGVLAGIIIGYFFKKND
jgi:hypothetical protein